MKHKEINTYREKERDKQIRS